jgi:hypothetical protein
MRLFLAKSYPRFSKKTFRNKNYLIQKGWPALSQTTLELTRKCVAELVHRNGFGRANVHARTAIAASVAIDDGQPVLHLDRVQRARFDAGLTTGAFFFINYGCHEFSPIQLKKAVKTSEVAP